MKMINTLSVINKIGIVVVILSFLYIATCMPDKRNQTIPIMALFLGNLLYQYVYKENAYKDAKQFAIFMATSGAVGFIIFLALEVL